VDISQHWSGLPTTVLSCIASEFGPLACLSAAAMKERLLSELLGALNGVVRREDVDWDRTSVFPNVEVPLFLNTVGAWSYRPNTRTRLRNLYIAGDWCRSGADLTTMEGAIGSAHATAARVLRDRNVPDGRGPLPIPAWPERLLRLAALGALPPVLALRAALWLRDKLGGESA